MYIVNTDGKTVNTVGICVSVEQWRIIEGVFHVWTSPDFKKEVLIYCTLVFYHNL